MMFGRGAGPSGINFCGAPPQQVFGAPQYRVPAALANIITNLVFLKASSLVKVRQATTCINSSLSFINSNMAELLIITRPLSNPTMVVG